MEINKPIKHIKEIETLTFGFIVDEYVRGLINYEDAKQKLKQQKRKGYELIRQLKIDDRTKHMEELEYKHRLCLDSLNFARKNKMRKYSINPEDITLYANVYEVT